MQKTRSEYTQKQTDKKKYSLFLLICYFSLNLQQIPVGGCEKAQEKTGDSSFCVRDYNWEPNIELVIL